MSLKNCFKYATIMLTIIVISFVLPRIIPGSPLSYAQYDTYILNQALPEETFNAFEQYYAPQKPVIEQFGIYITNLLSLDLGYSFYYRMPVAELISGRLPWTLLLSFVSIFISTAIGIWAGMRAGLKGKSARKTIGMMIGLQALPAFVAAALIQGIFAYRLGIFPSGGAYSPGLEAFTPEFFLDVIRHMVLPLISIVLCEIPGMFIMTYNSTKKIKTESYSKMAVYLNIDEADIKKEFILRNIVPEILGKLNVQIIYAITGSLFAEAIFSYPGIGQLLMQATSSRDYPLIQGLLMIICVYGLTVNIIFDVILKKQAQRH